MGGGGAEDRAPFSPQKNTSVQQLAKEEESMMKKAKIQESSSILCSQRWARFEKFPFPNFFPVEISILVHPKQTWVISKSDKQKQNKTTQNKKH